MNPTKAGTWPVEISLILFAVVVIVFGTMLFLYWRSYFGQGNDNEGT